MGTYEACLMTNAAGISFSGEPCLDIGWLEGLATGASEPKRKSCLAVIPHLGSRDWFW